MSEAQPRNICESVGIWTAIVVGILLQSAMGAGFLASHRANEPFAQNYPGYVFWVTILWVSVYWLSKWKNRLASTWLGLTFVIGPIAALLLLCIPRCNEDQPHA